MSNARELAQIPSTPSGRRNLIINGAMQVAQRGTSGTISSTNNYLVDRFYASKLGGLADIFDTSQVSDGPTGFQKSFKLTQDGTSVTLSGTNASMIGYRPEGQDFAHLEWGTSNAKAITVSFYVKSSITGTLAFTIASSNSDQDIAKEYTINSANTWEKKTLTIPGPTSGTWGAGASAFGYFVWGIAGVLGSARETTNIDAWGTGSGGASVTVTANSTNALATTSGATFQITGVQLEVGSVATEFEHRSYGEELALCQRYYQSIDTNSRTQPIGFGIRQTTNIVRFSIPTPVALGADPSIAISGTVRCLESDGSLTEMSSISGLYTSNGYAVASGTATGVVQGSITISAFGGIIQIDAEL